MIARFESQQPQNRLWARGRSSASITTTPAAKAAGPSGRWLLRGMTVLFLIWLIYHRLLAPDWLQASPAGLQELLWLSEGAGALTLLFVWLVLAWRQKTAVNTPIATHSAVVALGAAELVALSPREFEEYVAALFRQKGYQVTLRGRKGDHGVDLELMQHNGRRAIVQCKRYRSAIGPDVVRELYGTLMHERATHAFLVTTAEISESARQWAQGKPLTLIDGRSLCQIAAALTS